MKGSLVALVLLFAATASAKSSNPAFLGVGMTDRGNTPNLGPCVIETVTKDSAAHAAGLRSGDVFVAIDGIPVPNCSGLISQIQSHEPGDAVTIDIRRGSQPTLINAKLNSRADVMRERVVGQPIPLTTLVRVDDQSTNDLRSKGKTTIVGWFDQRSCVGCEVVFGAIERWSRAKSTTANQITIVGATVGSPSRSVVENVQALKQYQRGLDVPLLVADPETFSDLAITDSDRIHFMVIDCRGVVQYAAPLLPDGDDKAAVLDELYAAVEQAARRGR